MCILESPTSSFQVQSDDVKCFQAVEKITPKNVFLKESVYIYINIYININIYI